MIYALAFCSSRRRGPAIACLLDAEAASQMRGVVADEGAACDDERFRAAAGLDVYCTASLRG